MRLLFISPSDPSALHGGRAILANVHRDVLARLLGDGLATHLLGGGAAISAVRGLRGYINGTAPAGLNAVLAAIDGHRAETIWLDGSNLGRLAQALRRTRPLLRIITFCHNVEARFFLGALRRTPRPKAAGVVVGNYIAERIAMRSSDDVVALSTRDSAGLAALYGRSADHILPIAVADRVSSPPADELVASDAPLLFVGGSFYANRAGIDWFAKRVAPLIDARTDVIGMGMDDMRGQLEAAPGVRVIGAVDALEPHYRVARAAIAPIFDGSGMKTKVAEALMFGKRVIGTGEAFSGYEEVAGEAGWQCETPAAFVKAIEKAAHTDTKALDPVLRALYDRHYSPAATAQRMAGILGMSVPSAD